MQWERKIQGLVQQEHQLREGLGEKEREVGRLREQLLEKDQRIQELGARPRKRARAEDAPETRAEDAPEARAEDAPEQRPAIQINPRPRARRRQKPWSSLKKRQLQNKKTMLREDFVEPCFNNLPDNVVKANVNFRTDDGISIDVEWPQGPNDRRGQPPPGDRSPKGRGYRHQTEETKDLVKWCVHFKDQATVSDVWWHELHMKFKDTIPPIGWMKQERGEQNSCIPYQLEENARDGNGASRSVVDIIKHHLTMPANQHLLQGEEPVVSFRYGLDGRPQAKNNIIGAVMVCITPVRSLAEAQKHPRTVKYVVSDWKALAIMMGLVGPTGDYFCVLCYCNKENIAHFRQGFDLRTHEKAQMHCRDRRNQCGHKHLPVFKIPWGNVIIDTLQTYVPEDWRQTPKPAKELKTVIKSLPHHMPTIINDIGNTGQISIDALQGPQAAAVLRSMNQSVPWRNAERKAKLKRLLGEDAMANFGAHAGDQMAAHPFLHYVNCETIEKKNHVQTRRYHLATQKGGGRYKSKWAEQLMQMENRDTFAAMHGIGERKKRPWGQNRVQEDEDDNSSDTGFSDIDSDPEPPEPDVNEDDNRVVYDGDQDDL
ncbi:Hypp6671 [Branchiostoma lanceolatum]|uniref:Hypp6671 protein n=1 Tax=Branchiostoma lanceolatum TaxID=7740 RepID=A0A8J9YV80_BRALA|nr:Hypp6671 [Branchiostoma lanceolatum]